MVEPLTPIDYYRRCADRANESGQRTIVLMRDYGECYTAFDGFAHVCYHLLKDTLKVYNSPNYGYDNGDGHGYGYPLFGFGLHNLDRVVAALVKDGWAVEKTDYLAYSADFNRRHPEWEQHVHELWLAYKRREAQREAAKHPIQLTLLIWKTYEKKKEQVNHLPPQRARP